MEEPKKLTKMKFEFLLFLEYVRLPCEVLVEFHAKIFCVIFIWNELAIKSDGDVSVLSKSKIYLNSFRAIYLNFPLLSPSGYSIGRGFKIFNSFFIAVVLNENWYIISVELSGYRLCKGDGGLAYSPVEHWPGSQNFKMWMFQ